MSPACPASRAEVSKLLSRSRGEFTVEGRRTRGLIRNSTDVALSTTALDRIVDLDVDEQVLTAEAGVPLQLIDDALRNTGLFLAPTFGESARGTLGGLYSDPRELPSSPRLGRVRDMVLGIEAVRGDGTPFKAGGRVVKNVTGYDLTRFLCGGLGRWGVVTLLHWRLQPRPAHTWARSWKFSSGAELWDSLRSLRSLSLEPLEVAVRPRELVVTVSECGSEAVCEEHGRRFEDTMSGGETTECAEGSTATAVVRVRVPFSQWQAALSDPQVARLRWQGLYPCAHFGLVESVDDDFDLTELNQTLRGYRGSAAFENEPQICDAHPYLNRALLDKWDRGRVLAGRPR